MALTVGAAPPGSGRHVEGEVDDDHDCTMGLAMAVTGPLEMVALLSDIYRPNVLSQETDAGNWVWNSVRMVA